MRGVFSEREDEGREGERERGGEGGREEERVKRRAGGREEES